MARMAGVAGAGWGWMEEEKFGAVWWERVRGRRGPEEEEELQGGGLGGGWKGKARGRRRNGQAVRLGVEQNGVEQLRSMGDSTCLGKLRLWAILEVEKERFDWFYFSINFLFIQSAITCYSYY